MTLFKLYLIYDAESIIIWHNIGTRSLPILNVIASGNSTKNIGLYDTNVSIVSMCNEIVSRANFIDDTRTIVCDSIFLTKSKKVSFCLSSTNGAWCIIKNYVRFGRARIFADTDSSPGRFRGSQRDEKSDHRIQITYIWQENPFGIGFSGSIMYQRNQLHS